MLILAGTAAGQGREGGRSRERDPLLERDGPASERDGADATRAAPAAREGGIPRREVNRDRQSQDGSEEGLPEMAPRGRSAEVQPRWIPPRGDWKLGVWGYNTESGVVITRVASGSAAAEIGLERGDRIVSVGGYQVGYVGDLLYPLGFELQRQADVRGHVPLLVQNVRNRELMPLTAGLDRPGRPRALERDSDRGLPRRDPD
jgi:hypothetical protein